MPSPGHSPRDLPADLAFGRCLLRPAARQLLVDGRPVAVGARAFDLLLALVERRERVVGKDELLDLVWPGVVVEENNLQVHVAALRKHLGAGAIATVSGRGYRFAAELLPAAAPPAPPAAATPLAGPAPAAPLFGREHDLQTLDYLLQAHRLVNIVGAGGIGKTVLARAVATRQAGRFAQGMRFVDLSPLARDPDVAPALDAALAAGADAGLLLVLDNCEHRARAVAAWAAQALPARAGLRLLATSQEPLRLPEEQVYRVTALALPAGPGLAAARAASAVRLFEARARAADSAFVLGEDQVALVVSICRQLDGVALAIELAAARVPHLGLQGLHDRLHQRLRLLATAARDVPPRQRSLAAALGWSHALLSDAEQKVLRRLAVMAGPFSPASAQAVAAGDGLDGGTVLDALGSLVERSLVVAEAAAAGVEPRLRLLETVRQFARERLAEAGEEAGCRQRHLHRMVALAEQAAAALAGPAPGAALARLDAERDNLLAALASSAQGPDGVVPGLRLLVALHRWGLHREGLAPARTACAAMLAHADAAGQGALFGRALWVLAEWGVALGEFDAATPGLERCAAEALACGDAVLQVQAQISLVAALAQQGRQAEARRLHEQALAAARGLAQWPALRIAATLAQADLEIASGRTDAARPLYEEALRLARAGGDRLATLGPLLGLARLAPGAAPASAPLRAQWLQEAQALAETLDSAPARRLVAAACPASPGV
ncbi:MAG: winged helix-turn-helix domain-containing protein [Rubrivivax sp.]|nr:winged helix-turn-helix domain-containing protein [Rubrivivax sp.]